MDTVITKALAGLIPMEIPSVSPGDIEYLTGITPADRMVGHFPEEGDVNKHCVDHGLSAGGTQCWGQAFAWSKRVVDGHFILARRSPKGEETMLLKLDFDQVEIVRPTIQTGYAGGFYRAVRTLPAECYVSYYPTVKQGLAALDRAHVEPPAIRKTLEAISLHGQIAKSALESLGVLAESLLAQLPEEGEVKLADTLDPKNLARATEEARHALDYVRPPQQIRKSNAAD
jgi:hypothetical protein